MGDFKTPVGVPVQWAHAADIRPRAGMLRSPPGTGFTAGPQVPRAVARLESFDGIPDGKHQRSRAQLELEVQDPGDIVFAMLHVYETVQFVTKVFAPQPASHAEQGTRAAPGRGRVLVVTRQVCLSDSRVLAGRASLARAVFVSSPGLKVHTVTVHRRPPNSSTFHSSSEHRAKPSLEVTPVRVPRQAIW